MELAELFRRLSYGELSNLALSGNGSGTIVEDQQDKLISYTNDALLALHSRFVLWEDDLILEAKEHITRYMLDAKYAQSNPNPDPGQAIYILDENGRKFEDNLIRVMQVTTVSGEILALNDVHDYNAVFTPQPMQLQIPRPVEGMIFVVSYQANHPILPYGDLTSQIILPAVLEPALSAHIAYSVFKHMNGAEHAAKAEGYMQSFEKKCAEITDRDLVNSTVITSSYKFTNRGFI